jgi:hypothetical protein
LDTVESSEPAEDKDMFEIGVLGGLNVAVITLGRVT